MKCIDCGAVLDSTQNRCDECIDVAIERSERRYEFVMRYAERDIQAYVESLKAADNA